MLKYELKKLFTSRFIIAMLIILALLTGVVCAVNYHEYATGVHGDSAAEMLKDKSAVTPFTVTDDNIEDLIREQAEIAADDSNYALLPDRGGSTYRYGKYAETENKIGDKIANGEPLTKEEEAFLADFHQEDPNGGEIMLCKQINNTRYYYLWYMIERAMNEGLDAYPEKYNGLIEIYHYYADREYDADNPYTVASKTRLDNGIVCDLSFGWDCILEAGELMLPSFMAIIAAIGCIILFTGEYTGKTDTLVMSTKNGRRRVLRSKLLAGICYSGIILIFYTLVSLLFFGAFFTLRGGGASTRLLLPNGVTATYFQAFLIMLVNQFFALIAVCFSSFAISSFIHKTLPSVIGTFALLLVPFIMNRFIYIPESEFSEIIGFMPVNALSVAYEYTYFTEWCGSYVNEDLFTIPIALAVLIISVPLVYFGWRKHKVSA